MAGRRPKWKWYVKLVIKENQKGIQFKAERWFDDDELAEKAMELYHELLK